MSELEIYIRDQLIVQQQEGMLTLVYKGAPVVRGVSAKAHYSVDGEERALSLRGPGAEAKVDSDGVHLSRANDDIRLDWHVGLSPDLEMTLEVRNRRDVPVRLQRLVVLDAAARDGGFVELGAPAERWVFYQHGWQSWTPTFARHVGGGIYVNPASDGYEQKNLPHPGAGTEDFSSEWFTVLYAPPEEGAPEPMALLVGFTDGRRALGSVSLSLEGPRFDGLAATCYADDIPLEPGRRFMSEPLVVRFGRDPLVLLEQYADRVGMRMRARVSAHVPTGWCTWYYFYGENTAADVEQNAAKIKKYSLPLEYVLIDDGYQQAIGDWLRIDSGKFPNGMKAVADAIRAHGLKPGIWLAPFGVATSSETYALHPDWVLKDESGEPVVAWQHWGADIYALDLTREEVLGWLEHQFRVMSDEWGYELFKIDFIFAGAVNGLRHDPAQTRAGAYRQGIERIRRAIGSKVLLGCGAPMLPSIGVVDAMRIGQDVAFNWDPLWADLSMPAGSNAMRNTLARYFMQRRWWANDPDCVMVRTRHDQSDLVLNEMRTLVTFVALSGGLVLDSDNLPTIRPGRLKYLRQALPPSGIAARPVDLFEHENPRYQVLDVERHWGDWWVASLMNWKDRTVQTEVSLRALGIPPGRYHVYNFWRQRYVGVCEDMLSFKRHQPHESILLCLKRVSDQPELLSSTFHVTQGAVEVESLRRVAHGPEGQTLAIQMGKTGVQRGQLLFTMPKPWRATEVRIDGRKRPFRVLGSGLVAIRFRLRGRALVEVDCIRE